MEATKSSFFLVAWLLRKNNFFLKRLKTNPQKMWPLSSRGDGVDNNYLFAASLSLMHAQKHANWKIIDNKDIMKSKDKAGTRLDLSQKKPGSIQPPSPPHKN